MKVYEIISEWYTDANGNILLGDPPPGTIGANPGVPATSTASGLGSAAANAAAGGGGAYGVSKYRAGQLAKQQQLQNKLIGDTSLDAALRKKEMLKAKYNKKVIFAVDRWEKRIGYLGKLLNWLGFFTAMYTLHEHLAEIDAIYEDGQINDQEYKKLREHFIGQFELTLAPILVQRMKVGAWVARIAKVIIQLATGAGAIGAAIGSVGVGAAPGIAAIMAEELFFNALVFWLQSDAGSNFMRKYFFEELAIAGTIGDGFFNMLYTAVTGTDYYKKSSDDNQLANKNKPPKSSDTPKQDINTTSPDGQPSRLPPGLTVFNSPGNQPISVTPWEGGQPLPAKP
jgi:hypothetical protein